MSGLLMQDRIKNVRCWLVVTYKVHLGFYSTNFSSSRSCFSHMRT